MSIARQALQGAVAAAPEVRAGIRSVMSAAGDEAGEASAAMLEEVSAVAKLEPMQVLIKTGESVVTDMAKSGPLNFLKGTNPATLNWPKVSERIPGFKLDNNKGGMIEHAATSADAVVTRMGNPHPFWNKINYSMHGSLARYPLRIADDIKSPVANLNPEGRVESLLFPAKPTKEMMAEAMTSAANAERIFSNDRAADAAFLVQKMSAGFISKVVEVPAASVQEMMAYALKGSSDWIAGARGNRYTQYLRDWQGDFTRGDRMFMTKLFSDKTVPASKFPFGPPSRFPAF